MWSIIGQEINDRTLFKVAEDEHMLLKWILWVIIGHVGYVTPS